MAEEETNPWAHMAGWLVSKYDLSFFCGLVLDCFQALDGFVCPFLPVDGAWGKMLPPRPGGGVPISGEGLPTDPPARLGADRPAPLGLGAPGVPGTQNSVGGEPRLLHVNKFTKAGESGCRSGSGLNLVCFGRVGRFGFRGFGLGLGLIIPLAWLYQSRARWDSQVGSVAHGPAPQEEDTRNGGLVEVRSQIVGRLQPCGCCYPLTPSLPPILWRPDLRRRGPEREFNAEPSRSTTSSGPAQYSPTLPPGHFSTSPPLSYL